MTARCHNDSCSIEWSEVETLEGLKYQADVVLPDAGSIACIDDSGLNVKLVNAVAAAAGCRNILAAEVDGDLHATIPDAVVTAFEDASRTAIAADRDTDNGDYATTPVHEYSNVSGCDELVIVTGNLLYRYAVLGTGSAVVAAGDLIRAGSLTTDGTGVTDATVVTPFNAMVNAVVQYGISAAPSLTLDRQQFGVSGMMATFAGAQEYQFGNQRRKFAQAVVVPAGESLRVDSAWAYEGKDQTVNVIAYGSTVFATLGAYIKDAQFIALPFGG